MSVNVDFRPLISAEDQEFARSKGFSPASEYGYHGNPNHWMRNRWSVRWSQDCWIGCRIFGGIADDLGRKIDTTFRGVIEQIAGK